MCGGPGASCAEPYVGAWAVGPSHPYGSYVDGSFKGGYIPPYVCVVNMAIWTTSCPYMPDCASAPLWWLAGRGWEGGDSVRQREGGKGTALEVLVRLEFHVEGQEHVQRLYKVGVCRDVKQGAYYPDVLL